MGFDVILDRADGWTVVRASGEIDLATAPRLGQAVREQVPDGPVLVDLGGLTFMDSTGVRTIHDLIADGLEGGWTLRFAPKLRDNVRQVLWMTGILDAMPFEGPGPA